VFSRISRLSEPYAFHPRTRVIIDRAIWDKGEGLAEVCRTRDGMWQLLGIEIREESEANYTVIELSRILKKWPEVGMLSELRPGYSAVWNSDHHAWDIVPLPEDYE
jgi:hypothetical protein